MTAPTSPATGTKDKRSSADGTAWIIVAAILLVAAGLGIWYWDRTTFDQGELPWPEEKLRHDPEELAPGLTAYAARHESPNHHRILIEVVTGDIYP